MNKNNLKFISWSALVLMLNCIGVVWGAPKLIPAFPSAEGFGAFTPGGRGGKLYIVSNLLDYNSERKETPIPGSFRYAIEAKGPRIVVFHVSRTIEGKCPFVIREPYITIAGQTSPGGICVSELIVMTHNVVVRFMRIRSADGEDPAGGIAQDTIFDHCSISWGSDEVISFKDYSNNVTIQWNLIYDGPQPHSMGSIIHGLQGITVHHNLYAHLWHRTPRINGKAGFVQDIRNNVIYNFGGEPVYPGTPGIFVNIIGNYFKEGPSTPAQPDVSGYERGKPILLVDGLKAFISGNYYDGREDLSNDNWMMVNPHLYQVIGRHDSSAYDKEDVENIHQAASEQRQALIKSIRADTAWPCVTVKTDTARMAYEKILAAAGANIPFRDDLDESTIDDVRNKTGFIKTAEQIGKYPKMLENQNVPVDSDMDGMSDEWEILHGLDPNDPSDANLDRDGDGYTNIEEYLNYLAREKDSGGINPNIPFEWVYPPIITSPDQMSYGRDSGLKDWLQCFGDFRFELPVRFVGLTTAAIASPDKDAEIRYTIDGSEPTQASKKYKEPLNITRDATVRARAFKNSKPSFEMFKRFISSVPIQAEKINPEQLNKGLICKRADMTNELEVQEIYESTEVPSPHLFPTGTDSSIVYNGFINIPRSGVYKFNFIYPSGRMDKQDICLVKISDRIALCVHRDADKTVMDNIAMQEGLHKIEIIYRTRGYRRIDFYWQGPEIQEQKVPDEIFFHLPEL